MKVYNYGSINIDHIYRVCDFVRPGETLSSSNYHKMLGGKGANQSIALAKAGVAVHHIGKISSADNWIIEKLEEFEVKTDHIEQIEKPTGHAIIQVSDDGENSIILYGGANQSHSKNELTNTFKNTND